MKDHVIAPTNDPEVVFQATIAQLTTLTGLVQDLQSEISRMQAHMAAPAPAEAGGVPAHGAGDAGPSVSVAVQRAHAGSADQVTGKLKLPQPKSFSSSQHPGAMENFLFNCEQFFIGMSVPADKKVFFASGLLDGPIKTWWRHTCTVHQASGTLDTLYDWSTFHALLLARFRAVNALRHARDTIASLKQDGPVRTYAQKIQKLAMQVLDMTDAELLDRFMRGLKPRTCMEVTMREPPSFGEAVKLADRYDSLFSPGFGFSRQPSGMGSWVAVPPVPFLSQFAANPILPTPTPMEIDALRRRPAPLT
jgi:hypothetical protein